MSGILEIKRGSENLASLNDGEFYLNKNINAVQIGSGSAILTLLPINKTITGDIILNGSVYANNLTGSGALSASITTTQTLGGIQAGTTYNTGFDFTSLFTELIAAYQKPIISGLKLRTASDEVTNQNREVGQGISFSRVVITSSIEVPGTNYAQSLSITASGASVAYAASLGNVSTQNSIINLGVDVSRTKTTVGDIVFTINGVSSTGLSLQSTSTTFSFYFSNYLCASTTTISSNATAQTVIDNDVVDSFPSGSKNWSGICNAQNNDSTKWTYIIYPTSYGYITSLRQGGTEVIGAFTLLTNSDTSNQNFSITNSNGISSTYYVYKSNAYGAFENGVILTTQ